MTCSKGPQVESNPWLQRRGHSLCTWGACSTNWATERPILLGFWIWRQYPDPFLFTQNGSWRGRVVLRGVVLLSCMQNNVNRLTFSQVWVPSSDKPQRWPHLHPYPEWCPTVKSYWVSLFERSHLSLLSSWEKTKRKRSNMWLMYRDNNQVNAGQLNGNFTEVLVVNNVSNSPNILH